MNLSALFVVGLVVTIVAGTGIAGLILAAIEDGREDERQRHQGASSGATRP